jgi:hypothetical protein
MTDGQKKMAGACVLGLAVFVHVALVFRTFPFSVFTENTIPPQGDVSRYMVTTYGFSKVSGMFGYDPYMMAGYPVGLWNSIGRKGFELLNMLLPSVPLSSLYFYTLVIVSTLSPLVAWFAVKRFMETVAARMILFILFLVYWHLDTQVSSFWRHGNVFYPAMSYLVPVVVVMCYRILTWEKPVISGIWLALTIAVIFYGHTSLMPVVGMALLACLILNLSLVRNTRVLIVFFVSFMISTILVLPWLIPLLQNWSDYQPLNDKGFQGTFKHLVMDVFSDRVYGHHFDRNFLLHAAVVAGFAGVWFGRKEAGSRVMRIFGLSAAGCLAAAYSFSHVPQLQQSQPYRYLVPAVIMLVAPMAGFISRVSFEFMRYEKSARVLIVLLLVMIFPSFTAYLIDQLWCRGSFQVPASHLAVLDKLGNMSVRGRILCDDIYLGHIIVLSRKIPVIGDGYGFLKHSFAGMDDDRRLFGRRVSEWGSKNLHQYLKTYGVEYALFSSGEWQEFASGVQNVFKFEADILPYRLYRIVDAECGLVLKGVADVAADYDRIDIRNADSGELVLKLHYAEWLKADSGVVLEPFEVLQDPVPLIKCVVPSHVRSFGIRKNSTCLHPLSKQ